MQDEMEGLNRQLEDLVASLHRGILLSTLVAALSAVRRQHLLSFFEGTGPGGPSLAQLTLESYALEHLIALSLTSKQCSTYVCRKNELEVLLKHARAFIQKAHASHHEKVVKDVGSLRQGYVNAIAFHADNLPLWKDQPSVKEGLASLGEENQKYLGNVFPKYLGFTWGSFIKAVGSLVGSFFCAPGYVSRDALHAQLKDIDGADSVLARLEYGPDRAAECLARPPAMRFSFRGRLLQWHPLPSADGAIVVSGQLVTDSMQWYMHKYLKKSAKFLKEKGHAFEAQIVNALDDADWRVVGQNYVIMEEIVPGKSKAEYDIIACRDRFLLVVEAKAYNPTTSGHSRVESERGRNAQEFAKKHRLMAEYLAEHLSELSIEAPDCDVVLPALVSTYPMSNTEVLEGVTLVPQDTLREFLTDPARASQDTLIPVRRSV